ncbi:CinA family nicotinamide mononucleotide deamidase-related protein [Parabacteroides bouchesdurhonensis]|uniref:CinA family nicotinamide mononucleotide deamidase-related protein n=1 Tax=Parabacteroides bouchesdurhonensis TaxID=1936995 RepID=UPI000E4BD79C|nr:CinA family nicotinamide mononucleotide deamidase-related protein [Parabacteroides bouchesdurhonensis]RHJ90488.1 nicotinamide-nucleotide amidohydrolase family protein [Bacteroides sp. AM07-16]
MNVEIITIGDELLIGQVVDTNSAWMGQKLGDEGFHVIWRTTVGDEEQDMLAAFDAAMKRAQVILVTGGLGPTKDDITRKTLCRYFDCGIHFSEEVYQNIETMFARKGFVMNELTRDQAMVPDKCTVIQNQAGTAPCTWFERDGKVLVSMPGVPSEMKWLMTNEILPRLKSKFRQDLFIKHQTCWISGYTESALAIKLTEFEEGLPSFVKLAYLPQPGIIRLRLSAYASTEAEAEQAISEQKAKLHTLLEGNILVEEDKPVEELIGEKLRSLHVMMGTAESCTGGHIAGMITSHPGSSDYFAGGVVSYCNEVKHKVLGVSVDDLEKYGAVSRQVVEQMALGAMRTLDCDCSIATSGIAGPGGGSPEKPVGTVWIAAAYKDKIVSGCYHFGTVREQNIQRSANMALLMLLHLLKE